MGRPRAHPPTALPRTGRRRDPLGFPDHALIESLGLGSAINVPVQHGSDLLGVLAVLDRAGALHSREQVALVASLTPCLIPALLESRRVSSVAPPLA